MKNTISQASSSCGIAKMIKMKHQCRQGENEVKREDQTQQGRKILYCSILLHEIKLLKIL